MSDRTSEQANRTVHPNEHLRCKGVRCSVRSYERMCHNLRSMWRGITTPTGKPKKLPWFAVGWCSRCEEVKHTYSKRPLAERWRCEERLYTGEKQKGPFPHTIKCGAELRPLQPVGIGRREMHDNHRAWKEKYG